MKVLLSALPTSCSCSAWLPETHAFVFVLVALYCCICTSLVIFLLPVSGQSTDIFRND